MKLVPDDDGSGNVLVTVAGEGNSDPSANDPTVAPFINSNGPTFMISFRGAASGAPRFYARGAA